ncbi:MAG TPA: hypothetical protein VK457_10920 [Chloroflexota bacterium]|nr:hypothetical protein [Chloroflexota bacterium]
MPTHMKVLAVVLVVFAAVVLALSLNALMPHGVEPPPPAPSIVASSGSPSASPVGSASP